ncbi:hypothetical protein PGB90_006353 [Kerria lacca]
MSNIFHQEVRCNTDSTTISHSENVKPSTTFFSLCGMIRSRSIKGFILWN